MENQKYTLDEVSKLLQKKADEVGVEAYATGLTAYREVESYYRVASRLVENLDSEPTPKPSDSGPEADVQPIQPKKRDSVRLPLETEGSDEPVAKLNPAQETVLRAINKLNGGRDGGVVAYGTNIQKELADNAGVHMHYPMVKARIDELVTLGLIDRAAKLDDDHTYYHLTEKGHGHI